MTQPQMPPGWLHAEGDPAGTERYWDGSAWQGDARPATVVVGKDPFKRPEQQNAPPQSTTPVTPEGRAERLSRIVSAKSLEGYVVVDRDDRNATAVLSHPGKEVNHVLHVIITIFTCGLWLIPWLVMGVTKKKEERLRISIDGFGNLLEEHMVVK